MKRSRPFDPTAPKSPHGLVDVNLFRCTCGGLCFSVPASNLQAFLGVETWRCDRCKQLYGHNFGGHRGAHP